MTASPAPCEVIWAECPECNAWRRAEVVREHEQQSFDPHGDQTDYVRSRILECRGCATTYFQRSTKTEDHFDNQDYSDEEEAAKWRNSYWPTPTTSLLPSWMDTIEGRDPTLANILTETYTALDRDSRVLAAIGIRTAFDRATELLNIDPAVSFEEKLDELRDAGKIGSSEHDVLTTLADAGGAAAHRAWRPNLRDLDTLRSVLEGFLHRTFVIEVDAAKLKGSLPAKPTRKTPRRKKASPATECSAEPPSHNP